MNRPEPTVGSELAGETTITVVQDGAIVAGDQPEQITGISLTIPDWLYNRPLETNANGFASSQPTPPELVDRRLPTVDVLPLPTTFDFGFSINALEGEPLERSTWHEGCPVRATDLRYVTVSFWGFDQRPHAGELIVHADIAEDIVAVFRAMYEARFPIEEMRLVEDQDLIAPRTGDSNNSASYVCRAVTGGSSFSQHSYGLAIDVNPFHNPYVRDGLVLPELATSYLDRSLTQEGIIHADSVVVEAFAAVGWHWGGNWTSLKDYQHFSLNNR